MRPLFPTLATAKFLPSRPADPPSGVSSHLSSSWLPVLFLRIGLFSSCDLRSVTGNSDFGNAPPGEGRILNLAAAALVRPDVNVAFSPSFPSFGGVLRRRVF